MTLCRWKHLQIWWLRIGTKRPFIRVLSQFWPQLINQIVNGLFLSLRNFLMQREPIWAFFAWIFPMKLWNPILTNFSWVSKALPLSSMKTMNLFTILNTQFIVRLAKWRPWNPILRQGRAIRWTTDFTSVRKRLQELIGRSLACLRWRS